jgi:hypothetical protein
VIICLLLVFSAGIKDNEGYSVYVVNMESPKYKMIKFCDFDVRERVADGYMCADELCTHGGKNWDDYAQSEDGKGFLEALSRKLGKPVNELVQVIADGSENHGVCAHPRIVTHFAQWVDPEFKSEVSKWIEEWKEHCEGNTEKYNQQLLKLGPSQSLQREREILEELQEELKGKDKVPTPAGCIDLLTDHEVIEIETAEKWKHAIGQVMCYGEYYPERTKVIYLFDMEESMNRDIIQRSCNKLNVQLRIV